MPVASVGQTAFTVNFGPVLTAHLRNVRAGFPIEQAYDGTRILSQFEKDRERALNGGGYVMTQVSAMTTPNGSWYEGSDTRSAAEADEDTNAITQLCFLDESIKIYRTDVLKARGDDELFNMVENKFKQGMRRMRYNIELAMVADTTAAKTMTSLVETLAPGSLSQTGTVDGIDRSTETWWRNQEEQIGSISSNFNLLEKLSADCTKGGESDWDYAMCDQQTWLWLKELARTFLTLNAGTAESAYGKRLADLGIPVIEFEGKPIFWSPRLTQRDFSATGLNIGGSAAGGSIYFIKKSALDVAVHPDEEFKLIGPFPLENAADGSSQHGLKWFLMWAGQLCWKEPSSCGVAWDITA
jgi:hypothetical protein